MTKLSWDTPGERFYEAGIDQGVLYISNVGYAWSGLISVTESSDGGTPELYYIDGYNHAQMVSVEDFKATIEALSSPREFGVCDGYKEMYQGLIVTQQRRKSFGLSYRTLIGNDVAGSARGYKLHVVYNALAAASERKHASNSDTPEPTVKSWDVSTVPPLVDGIRPTAHFIIDSTLADPTILAELEDLLYGGESTTAALPPPQDLIGMFS